MLCGHQSMDGVIWPWLFRCGMCYAFVKVDIKRNGDDMDKTIIKDMKEEAHFQFTMQRSRVDYNGTIMMQAIQAYAALCQAEALERIADALQPRVITVSTGIAGVDADGMRDAVHNKGDQSIADAIGEQTSYCDDHKLQANGLCLRCIQQYHTKQQVADPHDEPVRVTWACSCHKEHPTKEEATECGVSHAS